jgi:hypothetical protein
MRFNPTILSDSSISGVRFVRLIFEAIYSLIFLVPVNTFARNCSQSLAIVRDLLLGGDINTPSNNFKP